MIFCRVFVFLCVVCAVFGFEESGENSTEILEITTLLPNSAESTEEDVVAVSVSEAEAVSTTENLVEVEPEITAGKIHPSNAQLQLNKTEPPHQIGTPCDADTSCADITNAYCKEGICHCQLSFIPHPDNGKICIKQEAKIGDKCETQVQCESVGAVCRNGVCTLEKKIASAQIPLSTTVNTASSITSKSFFILSATSLFLVY